MKKAKTIIRWLCVLPVAVLVGQLCFLVAMLINSYSLYQTSQGNLKYYLVASIGTILANGIGGYCYIIFGSKVAPSLKYKVSLLLFALLDFLCVFSLCVLWFSDNDYDCALHSFAILSMIASAYWATRKVKAKSGNI